MTLKNRKICYICKQESSSDNYTKVYTRKELVMMETTIYDFYSSFYIPAIQKVAFQLPHVCTLGKNHYDAMRHTVIQLRELIQDVLCCLGGTQSYVVKLMIHSPQRGYLVCVCQRLASLWKSGDCLGVSRYFSHTKVGLLKTKEKGRKKKVLLVGGYFISKVNPQTS